MSDQAAGDKQAFRERVWASMQAAKVARFPGAKGRIPNFIGAEAAARALAETPEWQAARTIKSNPDSPQLPVRTRALNDGKTVYMAVPKLASATPFIMLDPDRLDVSPRKAASIAGSAHAGVPVTVADMPHIDLIVCGTVAAGRDGARLGKGGGYSDLEFALATEAGIVDERTVIVTTVHDVQVLDEALPETAHDFRLDLIVTPTRVLRPANPKRPPGIIWPHLTGEMIDAIPALAALRPRP